MHMYTSVIHFYAMKLNYPGNDALCYEMTPEFN